MLNVFMVPVALDLAKNQKDLLNPALLSKSVGEEHSFQEQDW